MANVSEKKCADSSDYWLEIKEHAIQNSESTRVAKPQPSININRSPAVSGSITVTCNNSLQMIVKIILSFKDFFKFCTPFLNFIDYAKKPIYRYGERNLNCCLKCLILLIMCDGALRCKKVNVNIKLCHLTQRVGEHS